MDGNANTYDPSQPAKYINSVVEFRAGQTVKATDVNRWFNMLINQGDFNTAWLEHIMKELAESHAREAALVQRVTDLEAGLKTAQDNIAILCALHGRQPV